MADSMQDKLDRVRTPRVQIKYKVPTDGAMERKELPFLVGVLGDFSGQAEQKPLKERKFINIDRDNFNAVMEGMAPKLAFAVSDKLSGDADKDLKVNLEFKNMDDFSPEQVVEQVPILKELLNTREKLNELLNRLSAHEKLGDMLEEVLKNTEMRDALVKGLEQAKGQKGE